MRNAGLDEAQAGIKIKLKIFHLNLSHNGKASSCYVGDPGYIPGLGRSPGGGNDNPLQYYGLENPMDREAW